ncbi:MAG: bifunctional protein-serine/threonine kinase/phosphatase [Porticoccaceae bacterium]|nr:bifunctional protein-serine/threonine kinase/phosphatase [Porticoccaceae bacterium]
MAKALSVTLGQYSDAGKKPVNQDFYGASIPSEPLLHSKGIAIAIADGISSSNVSQIASHTAVTSFLDDYYCTSDAWSVKNSVLKVLSATNSWLFSQTHNSPHRFNKEKGYICTFSSLVLKSQTAHIFHCGDARIYHYSSNGFECLTQDHRHVISDQSSYLTRALGIHNKVDIDYLSRPVEEGDCFVLCTDGIHEFIAEKKLSQYLGGLGPSPTVEALDELAKKIANDALEAGSDDNISLQIVTLDQLPEKSVSEISQAVSQLPLPPKIEPRMDFDGYKIIRPIYISSRSHVFLAEDSVSGERVALKFPSAELKNDTEYLESLLREDWIAKRIDNPNVLKAKSPQRKQNYLYTVTEYVEGQNLMQWMIDNPSPSLEQVRNIIEQVAKGIQAFHRREMIHQDLRPQNIMIDGSGTVKIIDFGSTKVAGILDIHDNNKGIVGTLQYSSPEYFINAPITSRVDIFSLGVIAYQMLSGKFPYGQNVSRAHNRLEQRKLRYLPLNEHGVNVPRWIEESLKKALSINSLKRYYEVSEFIYDLRTPNKHFVSMDQQPLIESNPLAFWRGLSLVLFIIIILQTVLF